MNLHSINVSSLIYNSMTKIVIETLNRTINKAKMTQVCGGKKEAPPEKVRVSALSSLHFLMADGKSYSWTQSSIKSEAINGSRPQRFIRGP